jgi:hypothetical protein
MGDLSGEEEDYISDSEEENEDEEAKEREDLIRQIEAYHREFGDVLNKKEVKKAQEESKKIRTKYTAATPTKKLRDELDAIQKCVGGSTFMGSLGGLCVPIAGVIEKFGVGIGLKLDGPKKSLQGLVYDNQKIFESCIKELMCKYDCTSYMQPEVRLAMTLGACIMSVDYANKMEMKIVHPVPIVNPNEIKEENENKVQYKE